MSPGWLSRSENIAQHYRTVRLLSVSTESEEKCEGFLERIRLTSLSENYWNCFLELILVSEETCSYKASLHHAVRREQWCLTASPPSPASSVSWPSCSSPPTGCARPSASAATKPSSVKVRSSSSDLHLPQKYTQFYICNSIRRVLAGRGPGPREMCEAKCRPFYHPRLPSAPIISHSLFLSLSDCHTARLRSDVLL